MKERQIPFSGAMVRAILDGRKTQTRRVVRGTALDWLQPGMFTPEFVAKSENGLSPYGYAGDRLWIREAWRTTGDDGRCDDMPPRALQPHRVWYDADGIAPADELIGKYRPSMFMPRWASRITLEITGVRVERLQEISVEDCIAEGMSTTLREHDACIALRDSYRGLWDTLNAARGCGWDTNPWVWVVEFRRLAGA